MDVTIIENSVNLIETDEKLTVIYGDLFNPMDTENEPELKESKQLKTETTSSSGHSSCSLFEDKSFDNKIHVNNENWECKYLTCKNAIDLSTCDKTYSEENGKTIFDDAEYFSKNYSYKLLPITFENVDETIIHTEHNYCHSFFSSESESEDDCSRTMDYNQVKEKNYKKRKTKFKSKTPEIQFESSDNSEQSHSNSELQKSNRTESSTSTDLKSSGYSLKVHPVDLSASVIQEEKTDLCLREHSCSIVSNNDNVDNKNNDSAQNSLDKENQMSNVKLIEVTITRPDEKENYQPCDLFLNDIARLVPKLVEKDCSEIDILDRTCDHYVDFQKHRLYYIISESTWRLFQNANERVILTNDQTLGEPIKSQEKDYRPTYLVFDQFSLAKCLADYCKEIGGCFEYKCVEESKEENVRSTESVAKSQENENSSREIHEKAYSVPPVDDASQETVNCQNKTLPNQTEEENKLQITSDNLTCIKVVLRESEIKNCECSDANDSDIASASHNENGERNLFNESSAKTSDASTVCTTSNEIFLLDENLQEDISLSTKDQLPASAVVETKKLKPKINLKKKSQRKISRKLKKEGNLELGSPTKSNNTSTKVNKSNQSSTLTVKNSPTLKINSRNSRNNTSGNGSTVGTSSITTRSKSLSESDKVLKLAKTGTSQSNDERKNNVRKGTKRAHSVSENFSEGSKKAVLRKKSKAMTDEMTMPEDHLRRKTRSETKNIKSKNMNEKSSGNKLLKKSIGEKNTEISIKKTNSNKNRKEILKKVLERRKKTNKKRIIETRNFKTKSQIELSKTTFNNENTNQKKKSKKSLSKNIKK